MKLILLTGVAGCGKDTMADAITNSTPNAKKISLADPLKEMLSCFLGCSPQMLDDRDFKESRPSRLMGLSVREGMQSLGTGWGREGISQDVWVNITKEKIEEEWLKNTETTIIVSDIRYSSEAESFKKMGGVLIKVERQRNPSSTDHNEHSSEKGVEDSLVDHIFLNNKPSLKEAQLDFLTLLNKIKK
jgi:hypothetical protein